RPRARWVWRDVDRSPRSGPDGSVRPRVRQAQLVPDACVLPGLQGDCADDVCTIWCVATRENSANGACTMTDADRLYNEAYHAYLVDDDRTRAIDLARRALALDPVHLMARVQRGVIPCARDGTPEANAEGRSH